MKRFLAIIMSSILFAALFSWLSVTPEFERAPNVYYFGFFETFVFVVIYTGPVYLIAGWPFSILIDQLAEKYRHASVIVRYLIRLGLYISAGIVVGGIYGWLVFEGSLLMGAGLGLAASSLYFHLLLMLSMKK